MDLIDLKKKAPAAPSPGEKKLFPQLHMAVAGGLVFFLVVVSSIPSHKAEASRQAIPVRLPELSDSTPTEDSVIVTDDYEAFSDTPDAEILSDEAFTVIEETVLSGDSLSKVFQRAGLGDKAMLALIKSGKEAKALEKIYPGHKLSFTVDQQGHLRTLKRTFDSLRSDVFIATEEGYTYKAVEKTPDVQLAMRSNTIKSSLYHAGLEAGLNDQLIMELAGIFGWDVDFALDIRKGDSFRILFEERFIEGEPIGTGQILAAEFVNQSNTFKAVRYVDAEGETRYYSPSGKAMQKAFLRAPLDFRRISSNFNPRRLHPVTKTVRPHRGTDYAANRGTPVWASGDGRVVASGYTSANGNYVVIQHGGEIQTKYLHLHKRAVKKGDRVRQKQMIGTVGSTGMSTAPHLHYEFLVNGVHRNPRTIIQKLPKAQSIDKAELQRFYAQTQPLLAELEQSTKVASADADTTSL